MPYKKRLLTEGVDEDHAAVAVVAVGGGARLREVVLGERPRSRVSAAPPQPPRAPGALRCPTPRHARSSLLVPSAAPDPPKAPERGGLRLAGARCAEPALPSASSASSRSCGGRASPTVGRIPSQSGHPEVTGTKFQLSAQSELSHFFPPATSMTRHNSFLSISRARLLRAASFASL